MTTSIPSPPPAALPRVSIIVPVWNQWALTWKCLMAIAAHTADVPHEVIVVDNGSTDDTAAALRALEGVRHRRNDTNLGFGTACNQGAQMARAPLLVFLNNDTEPQPGWLSAMLRVADADARVAVVNPRLVFPDATIQHAGFIVAYGFPYPVSLIPREYKKPATAANERVELRAASAACLLVRAAIFGTLKGFDETFINGYEDIDLCFRVVRGGGRIIYAPDAVVLHHEAMSGGRFKNEAVNLDRFQQRWMGKWDGFDYDYRTNAGRVATDPARPGVSVVVVAGNALPTATPCLESLLACTGPQDEVVIVDDGSVGASATALAQFAAREPQLARLLRLNDWQGFGRAAQAGLRAATRDFAVVMPANLKVSGRWLDRLLGQLGADSSIGVLTPSGSGNPVQGGGPLFAPPDARVTGRSSVLDKLVTAGPRTTAVPATACLCGRRATLLALADDPALLLGEEATALAARLAQSGLRLAAAQDVFVARINQQSAEPRPVERERYLIQQSANLAAERLRETTPVGAPPARVTTVSPQLGRASIVILVRDNLLLTVECVESIYRHTHHDFELIVVDNGSAPDVGAFFASLQAQHGNVVLIRNPDNEGFPFGVNQGLAAARGEFVVLLNNDVVVTRGWLSRQLALLAVDPQVAVVGPVTNATSGPQLVGTATYAGLGDVDAFAAQWAIEHAGEMAFVPRLTGLCMVMRRSLVDSIGGMDTIFGYGNCEDDDFCLRVLRSGQQIAVAYDVFIHHHGSATFKAMSLSASRMVADNWALFCEKWQHQSQVHTAEALRVLAGARRFDPAADPIPVVYGEIFHPGAAPLALDTPHRQRLLCIPDLTDDAWLLAMDGVFRALTNRDPVAVVVRVDPPSAVTVDRAVAGVKAILSRQGRSLDDAPDVIIEASAIAPRDRGGLYTAATAFIPLPGSRARFLAREAVACGLPIVVAEGVRGFVDQRR
ncbi:MAG TPA: glycosyltransferase [Polyangia bacterium]|jgi:GT2 family glycosyltransferase